VVVTARQRERAAAPEWRDWKWQLRHRVRDADALAEWVDVTEEERRAIAATQEIFRFNITPYYASLMDPADPECPIRRQVVPRLDETAPDIIGSEDPLEEVAHSPVRGLIHNYRDRVAFIVSNECAIYCRYCLRKRMVGDAGAAPDRGDREEAIRYLETHPEVRDVLLTGGDPLVLGDDHLDELLGRLRSIPHLEIIRIGTRMPVKLPFRITPGLCRMLERHHPLWVNTHFNHPREITPEAAEAVDRLLRSGIPVGNQTVLLKGINDTTATQKALAEGLVSTRVRPYYLYQAQLVAGTAHLRTSIERGMRIMEELQGRTTGFAIPKYVLDTPFGKVPLNRSYVLGRAGERVVVRSWEGRLWAEPNPIPADETGEPQLPEIPLPPEAATLPI
jgi:lysine 2,3-aminomutase